VSVTSWDIQSSDSRRLADLLEEGDCAERLWQPQELATILRHQLSAPVQFDLGGLEKGLARKLAALSEAEGLLVRSFADLLFHPNPPVELLELTKRFAKACRAHPQGPLPHEIATLLYYASIVVAMLRCGTRITSLGDDSLRRGVGWLLEQPWLEERTRSLLNEGLKFLDKHWPVPP